ncbi:Phytoene dehydrogenase-related protein [Gracilibacillus ureilyticus]|uniref:Phytoene dehydrogenase-related protein n=1 Tax=Gracilibacillus ureilyticus TaxID=531814 RepID=A0A1H9MQ25_9BACI|nr:FAD-dependent oxidoreductase [Gracilibacillus ureilyticus]SER25691.1 Phytoene dehydrogenase-related protein [Gracilibacillus ureilyticus]
MCEKIWDVVIVGGGLAGYVAANFLAKAGLTVTILEKGAQVGGRGKTDVINGQSFNLGPHALYKKGNAKLILEELGITVNGGSPKLGGVIIKNKQEYIAPLSPGGLLRTTFLNRKEKTEWMYCLIKLNTVKPEELIHLTYQQWVEKIAKTENVQDMLYTLSRLVTYSHSPNSASAKVIVSHIQLGMKGVLYIDGGWQSLIDQLHNQAVTLGVRMQTKANVKQIVRTEDFFQLTVSDHDIIKSKKVVYSGDPNDLDSLLPKAVFHKSIQPIKAATLDVALTDLPRPEKLFAMGIDQSFYYSVHSPYAKLSENSTILHVLKYHSEETVNGKEQQQELEHFLDQIQPGWQRYKIKSRCFPHITVNYRLPKIGDETWLQSLQTAVPGLKFAGDWAAPGMILAEGAVESGKRAAVDIIQKSEELLCK